MAGERRTVARQSFQAGRLLGTWPSGAINAWRRLIAVRVWAAGRDMAGREGIAAFVRDISGALARGNAIRCSRVGRTAEANHIFVSRAGETGAPSGLVMFPRRLPLFLALVLLPASLAWAETAPSDAELIARFRAQ